jgi:hypothetical protein
VVYQRARLRRSVITFGEWPVRWYQTTTRVWAWRPNGTVRSTARWVRLRASPTPVTCLASEKATSMAQRAV